MRSTVLTNAVREQWPFCSNFDKSFHMFLWFLNIYRNTSSFKHWLYSYKGIFPLSPQMWTVCDSHVTPARARMPRPPGTELSRKTNIRFKNLITPPLSIRGNLNYIICERRQIPVLCCFQETLESGLKSKGATSIRSKSCVSSGLSHIFTSVIIQLHIFVSKTFFSIFYISSSSAVLLLIETRCLFWSASFDMW